MPVWPGLHGRGAANSGDWWRPFFVTDTGGFAVLAEDWVVGGDTEQDDVTTQAAPTAA